MKYTTEQEQFWAGSFGNDYVDRNNDINSIAHRTAVFSKILSKTKDITRVLEFGANIGHNLMALKNLLPGCKFGAIEINAKAIQILKTIPDTTVFEGSIFEHHPETLGIYDLIFTSGVLIHINPDKLQEVYAKLYRCTKKYILVYEYYNPTPVEVRYRGHAERLFKRDFAGEIMDLYPDLELVDYGFQYHRDNNFSMDDLNWFLLKRNTPA